MRHPPLVVIEWFDHTEGTEGWQDKLDTELSVCWSVGWLIKSTEDALTIVPHWAFTPDYKKEQFSSPMVIVKSAVLTRWTIKDLGKPDNYFH